MPDSMDILDATIPMPDEITPEEREVAIADFKRALASACRDAEIDGLTFAEISTILRELADED